MGPEGPLKREWTDGRLDATEALGGGLQGSFCRAGARAWWAACRGFEKVGMGERVWR